VVGTVAGNPCPVRATCRSSCDDVVGGCGSASAEAEPSRGGPTDMDPQAAEPPQQTAEALERIIGPGY